MTWVEIPRTQSLTFTTVDTVDKSAVQVHLERLHRRGRAL